MHFLIATLSLFLLAASYLTRHPGISFVRPYDSLLVILLSLILIIKIIKYKLHNVLLFISIIAFLISFTKESLFQYQKFYVLNADSSLIQELGRHLIVGYKNNAHSLNLASNGSVGGFYVTYKNFPNHDIQSINQKISKLQQSSPHPLIIATDQEGGLVQRFSPPLVAQPTLKQHLSSNPTESIEKSIAEYATRQAQGLKQLGINLNFAPVVDLDFNIQNPNDKYSHISKRAISNDPHAVAYVAQIYSQTINQHGVYPTLKHFPGLGRVENDTHISSALLTASRAELEHTDWIPFKVIAPSTPTFIMIGHAIVPDIDPVYPASFSPQVISILRNEWDVDNILITDDFSMYAVTASNSGVAQAAVQAINSGIDYILVSYDPDLYYEAMYGLIKAYQSGELHVDSLEKSKQRIHNLQLTNADSSR